VRTRRQWLVWLTAVGAASASATYVVDGPAATSNGAAARVPFAILNHEGHDAKVAGALTEVGALIPAGRFGAGQVYASRAPDGEVCVSIKGNDGSLSGSCAPASSAARNGVAVESGPARAGGPILDAALVPDGVDTVQFVDSSGYARSVRVVNNAVSATERGLALTTFTATGGRMVTSHIPACLARATCLGPPRGLRSDHQRPGTRTPRQTESGSIPGTPAVPRS
jgi:hypothetical protein